MLNSCQCEDSKYQFLITFTYMQLDIFMSKKACLNTWKKKKCCIYYETEVVYDCKMQIINPWQSLLFGHAFIFPITCSNNWYTSKPQFAELATTRRVFQLSHKSQSFFPKTVKKKTTIMQNFSSLAWNCNPTYLTEINTRASQLPITALHIPALSWTVAK